MDATCSRLAGNSCIAHALAIAIHAILALQPSGHRRAECWLVDGHFQGTKITGPFMSAAGTTTLMLEENFGDASVTHESYTV